MKTYSPKPADIERRWYVVDASGQVLGRLASEVAAILRGKHKPIYSPHMDTGDHVIVLNADKIELTGQKAEKKIAYRHSGYPGGLKATRYDRLLRERPIAAIEKAVRGMLPHNRLGRQLIKKLHVVAGPEHPHRAQQPTPLGVGERPRWEGFPVRAPKAAPTPSRPAKTPPSGETSDGAEAAPAQKRSAAKKTTAKKTTAKKTTAKKTTAKKSTAKASSAKKTTAKKTTAKKPTAKKPTAKKPTTEE
jgi:large subunit ribosomal protein L13